MGKRVSRGRPAGQMPDSGRGVAKEAAEFAEEIAESPSAFSAPGPTVEGEDRSVTANH